jgi:hypothetical protein
MKYVLPLLVVMFIASFDASSQIPKKLSYQGHLLIDKDTPYPDSMYSMTFSLYDASNSGNVLWSERQTLKTVNGVFDAVLGEVIPLTLPFDKQYWLGIAINPDPEFSPRVQLVSNPYSFRSDTANFAFKADTSEMSRGLTLDATGAVLSLNGKSGRIHIKAGAGVQISTIGDTLIIDGKDYKAGSGITIQNDTIFNSSMKDSSNAHNGCFKHYIGEEFGGGVIFHLWKDSKGIEHGLIVDLQDLGEEIWSNVPDYIGATAQSWDGLSNSLAIVGQAGHIKSAAALCLNSTNGGHDDWYLPSILELNMLWNNYYTVARSLTKISGATIIDISGEFVFYECLNYWSSTEFCDRIVDGCRNSSAWIFNFSTGNQDVIQKCFLWNGSLPSKGKRLSVRAIRAF